MICTNLHQVIGFECHPLDGSGALAYIATPFTFSDGDSIPVYVEKLSVGYRFFDDGQTLLHFMGRGMKFQTGHQLKFLSAIASQFDATLNEDGIIEVYAKEEQPQAGFASYVACMLQVRAWEVEHEGVDADASAFAIEVAEALKAWQPGVELASAREYIGASGKTYAVDYQFGEKGVLAITPQHQKAASALYKLVDITNRSSNAHEEFLVVIDDRKHPDKANNEAEVFRSVANVITYTKLAVAKSNSVTALH